MADKKTYKVVAAMISARTDDGRVHQYYAGATLPDGLVKEDLDRLSDEGYIATDSDVVPVMGSSPPELSAKATVPSNPTLPRRRG
jgi:hypothetical protein